MNSGILLYARCPPDGECLRCPVGGRAIAYGPFRSRRRGVSIGINAFPCVKVCSFNCVYCFRGPTQLHTAEPPHDAFGVDGDVLLKALEAAFEAIPEPVSAVDFSGHGEPTLHPRFRELVEAAKAFVRERGLSSGVGVFTNSSTLGRRGVVSALREVDYIEAKLDTLDQWKFERLNVPLPSLRVSEIVERLEAFSRSYGGTLAIQVMLVDYAGVANYLESDALAMAEALRRIEPSVVHLHTAYRTPRLSWVSKAPKVAMELYAEKLKLYGLNVLVYPD